MIPGAITHAETPSVSQLRPRFISVSLLFEERWLVFVTVGPSTRTAHKGDAIKTLPKKGGERKKRVTLREIYVVVCEYVRGRERYLSSLLLRRANPGFHFFPHAAFCRGLLFVERPRLGYPPDVPSDRVRACAGFLGCRAVLMVV